MVLNIYFPLNIVFLLLVIVFQISYLYVLIMTGKLIDLKNLNLHYIKVVNGFS